MTGSKVPTIAVHVTPRSGRDEVVGVKVSDDGLREVQIRVTAPPDSGKANKAACKLLALQLGVAKSTVTVKCGKTSRHKLIEVNASTKAVTAWMTSLPVC